MTDNSGKHMWFTAASGTAGNAITFTQAMTLDASGNLGVGLTAGLYSKVGVSGNIMCTDGGQIGWLTSQGAPTDYIDGSQASHYIRFITNNAERARIDSSGNLGVGTSSPKGRIDAVFGNTDPAGSNDVAIDALRLAGTGIAAISVRQYDSSGQPAAGDIQFLNLYFNGSTYNYYERMRIKANGNIKFNAYGAGALTTDASGNITAASDERIKSNIRPFSRGLSEILAINPILHGYTEESGLDQSRDDYAGFSAQQVQPLIPEAIGENANGMLSFSDRPVMAALVNAMKELNANLVAQVAALSQRLAALEQSN
jgi:hypothetical protein